MSLLKTITKIFQKEELRIPYHEDLGHGWLEVQVSLLKELGIDKEISAYSYIDANDKIVFLEEDVDATILLNHLKQKKIRYKLLPIWNGDTSFIRSLKHYG